MAGYALGIGGYVVCATAPDKFMIGLAMMGAMPLVGGLFPFLEMLRQEEFD